MTAWMTADPLLDHTYDSAAGILTLRFDNLPDANDGDGRFAPPYAVTVNVADDEGAMAAIRLDFEFDDCVATLLGGLAAELVPGGVQVTCESMTDFPLGAMRLRANLGEFQWAVAIVNSGGGRYCGRDDNPLLAGGGQVAYTIEIQVGGGSVVSQTITIYVPPAVATDGIVSIYPNPFNPRATVGFACRAAGHVQLAIYDLAGRRVTVLTDATLPPGEHRRDWNGCDGSGNPVAAGQYLVRLETTHRVDVRKLMLVR
jgi:hypothetical protein